MTRLNLLLTLILALVSVPASAQTFPALSGRVVDQANLLDAAQEQAIAAKAETLETASGRQFVVATVNSLEGYEIRDYGYQLGRAWKIGTKENDGVVLLIAPNERKVAIEVGYGLEPILTDALSSMIIANDILPRFKAGDMPGGITAGADAILAQISLPEAEAAARQQQLLAADRNSDEGGFPFALIFWIVVLVVFVLPMFSRGRRGRKYRGGRGPVVIWGPGWGSSGGSSWSGGSSSSSSSSWSGGGGGFSGGGGSFGGGGASGGW